MRQKKSQSVDLWSSKDVAQWLIDNGFQQYVTLFHDVHKIDGRCLLTLSEDDLKGPPLVMTVLGDIKRLSMSHSLNKP